MGIGGDASGDNERREDTEGERDELEYNEFERDKAGANYSGESMKIRCVIRTVRNETYAWKCHQVAGKTFQRVQGLCFDSCATAISLRQVRTVVE